MGGSWLHDAQDKLIEWGTRSEFHRPTLFEVIAEEIIPHVVLALSIFIFIQVLIVLREPEIDTNLPSSTVEDEA